MPTDLLVIQHYPLGVPGLLEAVAQARDRSVHIVRTFEGDAVPHTAGDAWAVVVLGGPMAAWEDGENPFLRDELALLADCIEHDTPTLGICLGAQVLARAAGARTYRGGVPEIGWFPVDLTDEGRRDPLFAGLPPQFKMFSWHTDHFDLPADATRLASSRLYPNHAFRIGKRVYGVQFHPEKTDAVVARALEENRAVLAQYAGVVDEARIRRETAQVYPKARAHAERLFVNFLERAEL